MVILHKDGKVYRLEAPNPLVKAQENWDDKKLIFHNFNWDEIKLKNGMSVVTKIKTNKEEIVKTDTKEIQTLASEAASVPESISIPTIDSKEEIKPKIEFKSEDQVQEDKCEPAEKDANTEPVEYELPYIKYKVLAHCLPAKIETKSDNFYGETWQRVKYLKKIVIPFIMISANDFSIEFWTSDPKNQITEKSIIYPFCYEVHNQETNRYDRVPYDEYRWWKVTSKEPKEKGWVFQAIPSDYQPDFSD